ncbi:MAG: bifunctional 4-hydroxy-2-oxoglutarate aldolase/2-dehydro-3-deoxy-phosphogluconate aldolase [Ferruginibacter sp.]|nr:bifunctional 4-hydroxy-2-oxoglutarate aldolase/2-dehydro-3-deoxy-phosphogluconate aldolase [Ferruginibacter sp.]
MTVLSQILTNKIVAIIRGAKPEDVIEIAMALYEGGIKCMEITLNSAGALQVIENIAVKLAGRILVGAGTVLDAAAAADAIAAGAKFIISPITDIETIHATKKLGAISIPGAFTPTEIFKAYAAGGDIIKVFPGSSGPGFIKEMQGPLPFIPLMPTGGIGLENLAEFIKAGAVAFGIGKSLVDTQQKINDAYLQKIIADAQGFMRAVNTI